MKLVLYKFEIVVVSILSVLESQPFGWGQGLGCNNRVTSCHIEPFKKAKYLNIKICKGFFATA